MNTRRLSIGFGIAMAALMVLSLFLPALVPNTTQQTQDNEPTEVPIPTFPPPIEDFSGITFDKQYLNPTGLFAVGVPDAWDVVPPSGLAGTEVSLNNQDAQSVITVNVEEGGEAIQTPEDVSNYFTADKLAGSWPRFQRGSRELRRDIVDDRVVIEFLLEDSQQREFFARHASWTDGQWIYTARVVVPENAVALLDFLLPPVIASVTPLTRFQDTPVDWGGYYDGEDLHVLRFPANWSVTDSANGAPASLSSFDGTQARVEADETVLESEDAARDWVESLRSGISVETVESTTREGGEGWVVTYSYTDPDGAPYSGMAVLLNGEDGKLHTAEAMVPTGGLNLLTDDTETLGSFSQVAQVLETFSVVTGLNLITPEFDQTSGPPGLTGAGSLPPGVSG